jgi:hypothetical protein
VRKKSRLAFSRQEAENVCSASGVSYGPGTGALTRPARLPALPPARQLGVGGVGHIPREKRAF